MRSGTKKKIERELERHWRLSKVPGMALAMTDRKGLLLDFGFGWQEQARKRKFTAKSLVPIGSIGKSVVALSLLKLAQRGRLDLDAPARRYLPWLKPRSKFRPFTVRELINHSAGIVAGPEMAPAAALNNGLLLNLLAPCEPGKSYRYSNVGYKLLGYIAEKVTGRTLAQVCRDEVLGPLGMKGSHGAVDAEVQRGAAHGHVERRSDRPTPISRPLVQAPWVDYPGGDGCVASHCSDLCAYLRYFLKQQEEDPRGTLAAILKADQAPSTGEGRFYNFGWFVARGKGKTFIGHAGFHVGYSSVALMELSSGLGVAITYNGPWNWMALFPLANFALELAAPKQAPKLQPRPETAFAGPVPEAARLVGTYAGAGKTLTFFRRAGKLRLKWKGRKVRLEKRGPSLFFAEHPELALFHLQFSGETGKAKRVWHGGEGFLRKGTRAPQRALPKAQRAFLGNYRAFDPWNPGFRIVARDGKLVQVSEDGYDFQLTPAGKSKFIVGKKGQSPETLVFDSRVDGEAHRALLSGAPYYKVI